MQSAPTPAHDAWHVPLTQLFEQQSPLVLQQLSSAWQFPDVAQPPASWPPPLPPPLLLPVPPSCPPLLLPLPPVPHLPMVHERAQHWANPEHEVPFA